MKRIIIGIIGASLITCLPADLSAAREGKVFGSYINVRSEPSHASSVVAKKLRGDSYSISFEDKGWLKVDFPDGTQGWIFNSVIEKQLAKDEVKAVKPASVASAPALPKDIAKPGSTGSTGETKTGTAAKADSAVVPAKKDIYEIPYIDKKADAKKESKTEKTPVKTDEAVSAASETQMLAKDKEKEKEKAKEKAKAEEAEKEKAKAPSEKATESAGKSGALENNSALKQQAAEANAEKKDLPATKAVSTSKTASEYYHEAIELYEKKRYQEALEANRAALQQAPRNAEILNNMGNCLFKMGKIQDAVNNWKEALKAAPKQAKICNNLGIAYYQLDENDRAIEFYKKAILFEPQFADAYYNLASVYGFKGQFRDALENYRKYLEFNPDATMKKLTEERIDYCQKQLNTGKKGSR